MTTITQIFKYDHAGTAGVVGQQPYKAKAKFDHLIDWEYVDKLNELTVFKFIVPNDEFHRVNGLLERKVFVPFLKPFRGIACVKSQDETKINMEACQFAFHLTRRIFRQNGNARVMYGSPLAHIQFEEDILDSAGSNNGTFVIDEETITNGFDNADIAFTAGEVYVGKISGLIPTSVVSDLTIKVNTAAGDIRIKAYDSVDELPTNLLGEGSLITVPGTGEQKFAFDSTFLVPTNGEIWIGFENSDTGLRLDTTASLGAGVETKSVVHTIGAGPDPFGTPVDETFGIYLKVHYTQNVNLFFTPGRVGTGFEFNEISRIDLANESNFDFDFLTNECSFTFWLRPNSTVTDAFPLILAKRDDIAVTDVGWSIYWDRDNTLIELEIADGTSEHFVTSTAASVPKDVWTHIAITFDGTSDQSGMKIYINGVLDTTGTSDPISSGVLNALTVSIGGGNTGARDYLGQIDDVRIYQRDLSANAVEEVFKTRSNPPPDSEKKTAIEANLIAQDILTSANLDMPVGVTWKLGDGFPTTDIIVEYNFENHWEALQDIAKILGKDLFFDDQIYKVFIETKGKSVGLKEGLDVTITSSPEVSTDNFANDINLLGKSIGTGEQLEDRVQTTSVLRFNYERVVSDNKLNTKDQLRGIGNALLSEFQKLTPLVKGTIPFTQFVRLGLQSGDVIPIAQPEKQLNGNFRVMDLSVKPNRVKISLERSETAIVRVRSLSLTDVIGGILKRLETQAIET